MTVSLTRTDHVRSATMRWTVLGVVVALALGGWTGLPIAVALPGLALVARIDADTHRIPNRLLLATTAVFLVATAVVDVQAAGAALAAGGAALGVLAATLLADPRLGGGDVKLALLTSAVAAWPWAADGAGAMTCIAAGLAALIAGLGAALITRRSSEATPLAPALTGASVASALAGLILRLL